MYRGSQSNKSSDYHAEMNWNVFSDRYRRKIFSAIAATKLKSVLVLDRATYYTVLYDTGRRPVTSSSKARLINSIQRWGMVPDDWLQDWQTRKGHNCWF